MVTFLHFPSFSRFAAINFKNGSSLNRINGKAIDNVSDTIDEPMRVLIERYGWSVSADMMDMMNIRWSHDKMISGRMRGWNMINFCATVCNDFVNPSDE